MPGGGYAQAMVPTDGQATLALVLGIISVVGCGCGSVLGPVALFIGNASRQRIAASGGTLGGGGMATAGFVLGIFGTIILVGGVLILGVDLANFIRSNG
jgi:hypothetical protein